MLSRSSFNIRKLISQRRTEEGEERRASFDHGNRGFATSTHSRSRSQSWITPKQNSTKKAKRPVMSVERSQSARNIPHPLPPVSADMESPFDPLCTCDDQVPARNYSGIRSQQHRQPTKPTRIDTSRFSSNRNREVMLLPTVYSPVSPSRGETTPQAAEHVALRFHPGDAFTIESQQQQDRSKKESRTRDQYLNTLDDNVRRLIQEADDAFNPATSEAQPSDPQVTPRATNVEAAQTVQAERRGRADRPVSVAPELTRSRSRKQKRASVAPRNTPKRASSVAKRKTPKARRQHPPRKSKPFVTKQYLKWNLAENVSELLGGRLFHGRIEADELLSPAKLHEIRMRRLSRAPSLLRPQRSSETVRSGATDATGSFDLQDLPSRIGAAGIGANIPSPIPEVPTPKGSAFEEPARLEFSAGKQEGRPNSGSADAGGSDPTAAKRQSYTETGARAFPEPPTKTPTGLGPQPQQAEVAIPEVTVTTPPDQDGQEHTIAPADASSEEFVYFQSTPYSLILPSFRHGPIRFAKADLTTQQEPKFMDDTLDWTAFQMAILGGAGDFFDDSADFSQKSDADELEELYDWFEEYGFEGYGQLVSDEYDESTPDLAAYSPTSDESMEDQLTSGEPSPELLPIPIAEEHPSGFWNEGDVDPSKFYTQGCELKRWTVEGHPKKYLNSGRGSMDSLSQAPVMDVRIAGTDDTDDLDVVPMGYNLMNDLGDFLKWEADHVAAAAYYGPD